MSQGDRFAIGDLGLGLRDRGPGMSQGDRFAIRDVAGRPLRDQGLGTRAWGSGIGD